MNKLLKQAFTLIELLVVIAIIGILSGLIVVAMGGMTAKANIAKSQVFSNSLRNSLMLNIVAQYTFDEVTDYDAGTKILNSTAGNIPDSWANFEGRAYAGPLLKDGTDCVSGKCLSFDGVDDYVLCGTFPKCNTFTIELWINGLRGQSVGGIVHSGGGSYYRWGMSIEGGSISSRISNDVTTDAWSMEDYSLANYPSGWHLITLTSDGTTRKYYKNGVLINQHTNTISNSGIDENIFIGMGGSSGSSYFTGSIDNVRIYNSSVSISQIKQNYYSGLNSFLANGIISIDEYASRIDSIAQR